MSSTIAAVIQSSPCLHLLSTQHIELLQSAATSAHFELREIVVRAGEPADEFHLIRSGKIALEIFTPDRGPVTVQTLAPGEVLGWSWLVRPYRWQFDAQAIEPTDTVMFDAAQLRAAGEKDPTFEHAMLKCFMPLIVARLQAACLQLVDMYHARR